MSTVHPLNSRSMGPQVTAAILIFVLLQKSSKFKALLQVNCVSHVDSITFRKKKLLLLLLSPAVLSSPINSAPLLSNLVPSQNCKCSWVSSESWEQSLQLMLFTCHVMSWSELKDKPKFFQVMESSGVRNLAAGILSAGNLKPETWNLVNYNL